MDQDNNHNWNHPKVADWSLAYRPKGLATVADQTSHTLPLEPQVFGLSLRSCARRLEGASGLIGRDWSLAWFRE